MTTQEFGSFSKDVATHLGINSNTLRRWSIELENHGYEFTRNEKKQRIYYERDLLALSDFQRIIGKTQNLENAGKAVVSMVNERKNAEKVLGVIAKNDEKNETTGDKLTFTREEFDAYIQRVSDESAAKTAEAMMQKFSDVIEHRDMKMLKEIRYIQEEKTKELMALAESEKPSLWTRLFGKKNTVKSPL